MGLTLPPKFYMAKKGQKILVVHPMGNKLYKCIDDDYRFKNGATLECMWLDEVKENNQ